MVYSMVFYHIAEVYIVFRTYWVHTIAELSNCFYRLVGRVYGVYQSEYLDDLFLHILSTFLWSFCGPLPNTSYIPTCLAGKLRFLDAVWNLFRPALIPISAHKASTYKSSQLESKTGNASEERSSLDNTFPSSSSLKISMHAGVRWTTFSVPAFRRGGCRQLVVVHSHENSVCSARSNLPLYPAVHTWE